MTYTAIKWYDGSYYIRDNNTGDMFNFAANEPRFELALIAGLLPMETIPAPILDVVRGMLLNWFAQHNLSETDIANAIAAYITDETARTEMLQNFYSVEVFQYSSTLVSTMRDALGYTQEQMDTAFREAPLL